MSFKVGDWVVRKLQWQCGNWHGGSKPYRVVAVSPSGNYLTLGGYGLTYAWDADFFSMVAESHTDADLAMALQLADLLHENSCFDDWYDVVETQWWLRAQVMQELLNRGVR